MIALALLLAAAADPARAKAAEAEAFAAVDASRWCPAYALFLEANDLEPSPDLIYNAAQAAELGGDRAKAVELFEKLIASSATPERKADGKQHLADLKRAIAKSGPGTACSSTPKSAATAPSTPPSATASSTPPSATASSTPPSATASSTPPSATASSTPPPPSAATTPAASATAAAPSTSASTSTTPPPSASTAPSAGPAFVPLALLGGGAAVVVAGVVVASVGAGPWFAYGAAHDELARAQATKSVDVGDAFARQTSSAADWDSWGKLTTSAGVVVAAAGVAAVAAGAYLLAGEP